MSSESICMKMLRSSYDPAVNLVLPYVKDDTIIIPNWPRSCVLVEIPDFVACNHVDNNSAFTYYFFMAGPREVDWDDLNDTQRMLFRSSEHNNSLFRQSEFPYDDDRYYTLEALCD